MGFLRFLLIIPILGLLYLTTSLYSWSNDEYDKYLFMKSNYTTTHEIINNFQIYSYTCYSYKACRTITDYLRIDKCSDVAGTSESPSFTQCWTIDPHNVCNIYPGVCTRATFNISFITSDKENIYLRNTEIFCGINDVKCASSITVNSVNNQLEELYYETNNPNNYTYERRPFYAIVCLYTLSGLSLFYFLVMMFLWLRDMYSLVYHCVTGFKYERISSNDDDL